MKGIAFFAAMLAGSYIAVPLGGLVLAATSLTMSLPFVGRASRFLLRSPVRGWFVVKMACWALSSSGLIVGYLVVSAALGAPERRWHWIAIAAAAAIAFLDLGSQVLGFEIFDVSESRRLLSRQRWFPYRRELAGLEGSEVTRLDRQGFADMNFILLIHFLTSFGMLTFASVNLGLISVGGATGRLTWVDCVSASLSLASLGMSDGVAFGGPVWLGLRFVSGLVVLVWLSAFIAFAISDLGTPGGVAAIPRGENGGKDPVGPGTADRPIAGEPGA